MAQRHVKLRSERMLLKRSGEGTAVVKTDLPDSHGAHRVLLQPVESFIVTGIGPKGVDAGRRINCSPPVAQRKELIPLGSSYTRDNEAGDTGVSGAAQKLREAPGERGCCKVAVGIDKHTLGKTSTCG